MQEPGFELATSQSRAQCLETTRSHHFLVYTVLELSPTTLVCPTYPDHLAPRTQIVSSSSLPTCPGSRNAPFPANEQGLSVIMNILRQLLSGLASGADAGRGSMGDCLLCKLPSYCLHFLARRYLHPARSHSVLLGVR